MTSSAGSPGRPRTVQIVSSRDDDDGASRDSNYDDPHSPTVETMEQGGDFRNLSSVFNLGASHDEDDASADSNFEPEMATIASGGTSEDLGRIEMVIGLPKSPKRSPGRRGLPAIGETGSDGNSLSHGAVKATLESEKYDAATIRREFRRYQALLPKPDKLLQEQHSFPVLRKRIEDSGVEPPRFLQYKFEGGIKPHHALCCLLLSEYQAEEARKKSEWKTTRCCPSWTYVLSCGKLHAQINDPAAFIRDQFFRVAHAIPTDVVNPHVLRKKIKNRGLPVPNYFLDPEDDKQFAPHIALLVILQDGEAESGKFHNVAYRAAWSAFAVVALFLRVVLEVIGGAGAIWGGAEVFTLRTPATNELWRWISVAVGVLCFLRFLTLNAPQLEDEGDILGPAGPWSLRTPVRLRAVCDHPFHYFVRAMPPSSPGKKHD